MIKGFLNLPWFVWAGLSLVITVIYVFFIPQKISPEWAGLRLFIVRWGHSLTWILLAVNFLLRGISPSWNEAANTIAVVGGLMYLLFMITTFVIK